MRRFHLPQMNTKVMCAVLTAAMLMTGFTACGSARSNVPAESITESSEPQNTEESTEESTEEKDTLEEVQNSLGEITAIDGNSITIALAENPAVSGEKPGEFPEAPNRDGKAPMDEKPQEARDQDGKAPEGEKPQAPEAEKPGEEPKDMLDEMTMRLTGETITITLSDTTIITVDGQDATIDDLQVGDTVFFIMENDTVNSISVGNMPERIESEK